MKIIEGLYYTKNHEWLKVSATKAYAGITDYAQHELGDIVYVELPETGTDLKQDEAFGAVESVKAASDIFMPVSGTITEANDAVVDDPSLVNQDAFENWMISFDIRDLSELENLMDAAAYEEFCNREE
ncbi:glycine cleavage system H protein [Oxobacter pfennigii]|uniref:Glycine cleavage system H protein n=1 Tax=Oxobacter pfennigii TaxID=36849 RepID=A0A0P8WE08_9CLOT|nr:glycine cleavage system protein GcvH [Oxobacter pfennigii]KPU45970.1 glycine cleavage system H protein [Oxobacter pfennigii]